DRERSLVGAIVMRRLEMKPFSDQQVKLLETFADQAVIAVENVRLFKELETRNRELTTALEQQTATSEILRVISSSPPNVQPVFDTIAESVVRLCDGRFGMVFRFDGQLVHLAAHYSFTAEALAAYSRSFPRPTSPDSLSTRAILERAVVNVPDLEHDPSVSSWVRELGQVTGYRSAVNVPMLRDGSPLVVISAATIEA